MRRNNIRVFVCDTAEEALAYIDRNGAELVITELTLPGIKGDDLCRRIRAAGVADPPSVLIVATGGKEDIDRCIAAGADAYLLGPVGPAELFKKTAELLNVAERQSYRVLARISVHGRVDDVPFFGTIIDLSVSGMLIEVPRELAVGDRLTCSFFLLSKSVSVEGEIKRLAQRGEHARYGVQFIHYSDETRELIAGYIDQARS